MITMSKADHAASAVPHNRMTNDVSLAYLKADTSDFRIMKVCSKLSNGCNAGPPRHWEKAMRASYGMSDAEARALHDEVAAERDMRRMAAMFRGAV